jgi:hypothetical protein
MKVVIAGSRRIHEQYYKELLIAVQNSGYHITEVVSGCAIGVDRMGEKFAQSMGIPVRAMPADWSRYGPSAGPIRNQKMAEYADAAIVLWDGKSTGSKNMYENMKKLNKPVFLAYVEVTDEEPKYKNLKGI